MNWCINCSEVCGSKPGTVCIRDAWNRATPDHFRPSRCLPRHSIPPRLMQHVFPPSLHCFPQDKCMSWLQDGWRKKTGPLEIQHFSIQTPSTLKVTGRVTNSNENRRMTSNLGSKEFCGFLQCSRWVKAKVTHQFSRSATHDTGQSSIKNTSFYLKLGVLLHSVPVNFIQVPPTKFSDLHAPSEVLLTKCWVFVTES